MWAVGWSYPSKAKRAINGRAYHLDSVAYATRAEMLERLQLLKDEPTGMGVFDWYKGTKFFPVEIVFGRFSVGENE